MSIEALKNELTAFLNSEEPGVFAIKGKWGVGKTHLIHETVKANKNKWQHKKSAYASLFGINSLDDLKEQIFVKLQTTDSKKGNLAKTAGKHVNGVLSNVGLATTNAVSGAMKVGIKIWMEYELPNSKIFIDDIERRGNDLSIRNLLGFLSQLKEEKNCQIILIFNKDELNNEDKEELEKYREKIIDLEIEFVPNVDEIIKIGLRDKKVMVIEILKKLNVDNIRAVNKIERFLEKLEPRIKDFDFEVQNHIVHSATVLGWFYFNRNKTSIPWEFIKELEKYNAQQTQKMINRMLDIKATGFGVVQESIATMDATTETDTVREKYTDELKQSGYEQTGLVEKALMQALEQGFYDEARFTETLKDFESKIKRDKAIKEIQSAYDLFYESFDNDENRIVDTLVRCFETNSEYYDPKSLENAIEILEALEHSGEAGKIFSYYFSVSHTFEEAYEYRYLEHLKNISIIERVKELIEQNRTSKDIIEIVKKYVVGNSFNDTIILQKLTEDEWASLINGRLRDTNNLRFYIHKILDLGKIGGIYQDIGQKVANVLRRLASQSKINKLRIAGFQEILEKYSEVAEVTGT